MLDTGQYHVVEMCMGVGRQRDPKITSKFVLVRPTVSTRWFSGRAREV